MIKAILSDFSETILFPKDQKFHHNLNGLHHKLMADHGNYNAWDYFKINEELLEFYKSLKPKISLYVFTTDAVQDQPQIKEKLAEIFDKTFSAKQYNLNKKLPESYLAITAMLKLKPSEILYIDDRGTNLDAASASGLQVLLYTKNELLFKYISDFINKF